MAGCGDDPPAPTPPPARVKLDLTVPRDGTVVRRDSVRLAGNVVPGTAAVSILGRPVEVQDGAFTTEIELDVGANVIDVMASSGRRRPAMAALRITRQVPVVMPDLVGASPDEARDRLAGLGLRPRIQERRGGILDQLLPIDASVCSTDPEAGTELTGGADVDVVISKLC